MAGGLQFDDTFSRFDTHKLQKTLTLMTERQSARMSKITNDGLTRSGTYGNSGRQRVKICVLE